MKIDAPIVCPESDKDIGGDYSQIFLAFAIMILILVFMSNDKKQQEQPKPTAPKIDRNEVNQSIKSHEKAIKNNQIVNK